MVRVGAKRRLDFGKSTPKSPLGKRKTPEDPGRSSKRTRMSAIPYQTPESINKVLKAISVTKATPPSQPKTLVKRSCIKAKTPKSKPAPKKPIKRLSPKSVGKNIKVSKPPGSLKQKQLRNVKLAAKNGQRNANKKAKGGKSPKSEDKTRIKQSKSKPTNIENDTLTLGKRRSKKETLNPRPHLTVYEKDPTLFSNMDIPHISTLAQSRLLLRAVMMHDTKLLKKLVTTEAPQIYSLCIPRSVMMGDDSDALETAVKLRNKDAIKILSELEPSIIKKLGPCPDLLIHSESTGHGSRMMFGHGLRAVTVGRGGKEGHAALLKDESNYNMGSRIPEKYSFQHIIRGIEDGMPWSMVEFLLSLNKDQESNIMGQLYNNIDNFVRYGNIEVAGKLAAEALKRGGYGFNFLHVEALSNTNEPFSAFKPVSVVKKSMSGSRLTPLHCSAVNPNPYYLQTLLNSRPEYSIVDRQNWMPIHYAAVCVGDGPLKLLLSRGVSTLMCEKDGNSPLILSISRRRLQNVQCILSHELQNVGMVEGQDGENDDASKSIKAIEVTSSLEKMNKAGWNPLRMAVKIGNVEIVKELLKAGADPEKFTPSQFEKLTPLMIACLYGHLDVVKLLINHGVKVAVSDRRGRTAIFHCVINGHTHILSYLLRIGVNHEVKDSSGNTLAHYAAAYGWYFALKLLLEVGCDVVKGNDWKLTPIAIAFMKGHIGIVEMLVKEPGVEVNTPVDGDSGMTLLLTACSSTTMKSSIVPRLKFLVDELGADCTTCDFKGNNALHHLAGHTLCKEWEEFALMFKNLSDAVKFLVDRGCNLNALNFKNESPLMIACTNGNYWIAEKLIEYGVKLNSSVESEAEETILHKLAAGPISQHVQHLYEKLAKDADNFTALKEMAQMKNKKELTPLFKVFLENTAGDAHSSSHLRNFVTFLVKKLDSDVNATMKNNGVQNSILHVAVNITDATKVIPILQTKNLDLDPLDKNLRTPLANLLLKQGSSSETASFLIKAGANINFKNKSDDSLGLLLLLAMHQPKMFGLIPEMIAKGADIREVDPKTKNSALHFVSKNPKEPNALEAIKALVKAGANPNLVNIESRTPLHLVVNARGNETDVAYDIEDFLISSGADLRRKDIRGRSPLHYAFVKIGKPFEKSHLDPIELVMLLLNSVSGTNKTQIVKIADVFGGSPLHYAAMRGATICCTYFTSEMKDNVDIKDKNCNTPFGLAVWCGHEGSSLHFQQKGADFLQILDTNIEVVKQMGPESKSIDDDQDDDESDSRSNKSSASNNSDASGEDACTVSANKEIVKEIDNERGWIWDHKASQNAEIRKMKMELMKYPIFQEVVKREWQGILHLMIGKLQSSGSNMSIPVSTAIKTQKLHLAIKLIHRVKNPWELLTQSDETLLHTLAKYSEPGKQAELQVQVLKMLVEKGLDPKQGDSLNCNAISLAAMNQNYDLVAAFEDVGLTHQAIASLGCDKLGRTPFSALFWKLNEFISIPDKLAQWAALLLSSGAASANLLTKYPFLLSRHPGVRYLVKYHGDHAEFPMHSPLVVAVLLGRYNVVKWLCRQKSNVSFNFGDETTTTPIMHAVRLNDLKMVKLLLNPHSYDVELDTDPWNATYSNWVRGKSSSELIIDAQDKRGWTAVDHLVCPSLDESKEESYSYANVDQILTILHKAGASFTKKSGDNKSPLERAVEQKKFHIVNAMNKILKIPQSQQQSCPIYYGENEITPIQNDPTFGLPIKDFCEDAQKIALEKVDKMASQDITVLPDPLLCMEPDNSEVVVDSSQNIPFDCVLTQVDVSYGLNGLYNFYKMQVVKQPLGKQLVVLFTQWGRVGMEGQYQKTPFPSEEDAIKEFKKIFRAKSGNNWEDIANFRPMPKRYRLVHKDMNAKRPNELTVDFDKLENVEKSNSSKMNTDVYKLIKSLTMTHKIGMSSSHEYRMNIYQAPLKVSESLPIISTEALHKADAILNRIKIILAEKHKMHYNHYSANYSEEERLKIFEQLIEASEEFYALVPVYGFASEALSPIFEFSTLHERQEEIYRLIHLGFAKELILAAEYNSALYNPFEYVYRCLGTKLAVLDMGSKSENFEGQLILQYIHNTSPKTTVEGIYRIQGAEEHEITLNNRYLLWHGTKPENVLSILYSGLQIAPLGVDRMGELFGKGIYFADTFDKSESYASAHGHRRSSKFIFLCEVALGKIQDVRINSDDVNNHTVGTERSLQKGFNSSKTADSRYIPDPASTIYWNGKVIPFGSTVEKVFPKNQYSGLDYNEYIIFNPEQVKLRYLIQFK